MVFHTKNSRLLLPRILTGISLRWKRHLRPLFAVSVTFRTGGYAHPAGVFLAIFTASGGVEAVVDIFGGIELEAGEGSDRAGLNAGPAFPARFIHHGTCIQGCIGEHRGEADPGSEGLR